jgi:hypothetical protein
VGFFRACSRPPIWRHINAAVRLRQLLPCKCLSRGLQTVAGARTRGGGGGGGGERVGSANAAAARRQQQQ